MSKPKVRLKGVRANNGEKNRQFIRAVNKKYDECHGEKSEQFLKEVNKENSVILSVISSNLKSHIGKYEQGLLVGLESIAATIPSGTTDLQIKKFILNDIDFPTDFGKFRQAKLELFSRYEVLINAVFDYKKTEVEIEKLKAENEVLSDKFLDTNGAAGKVIQAELSLKEIEIQRKQFQLTQIEQLILVKIRESKAFYDVYYELDYFDKYDAESLALEDLVFWKNKSGFDTTERIAQFLGMPTKFIYPKKYVS